MGAGASSAQQVVQEASDTQALEALTALYLQDASRAAMLVESAKSAALEQKESGAAPEATPEASKRDWDAFRAELCAEHNLARAKPLEYAETRVRPMLARFDDKRYRDDGGTIDLEEFGDFFSAVLRSNFGAAIHTITTNSEAFDAFLGGPSVKGGHASAKTPAELLQQMLALRGKASALNSQSLFSKPIQ